MAVSRLIEISPSSNSSNARGGQAGHGVSIDFVDDLRSGQEVVRLDEPVADVVDKFEDGNVSAPPSLLIHREIEVAFLDHAEPRVGSTVPSAPKEVALFFSQKVEAAFSSIEVSDASGARVDQGKAVVDAQGARE